MQKRIFAAIEISKEARQKAADHIRFLRERFPHSRVSWDKPEKLHLTLKFFGDIEDEQIVKIIEAAQQTIKKISPFKMSITGTGVFPSPSKAHVLWLGIKDQGDEFSAMHRIFEDECLRRGFKPEKRIFKPHLTIARLKETNYDLARIHLSMNFLPVEMTVSEIHIIQSLLRQDGAVYSLVAKIL